MWMIKAGPGYELLGKRDLGEAIMATPAITGGMLIVRGERHLFALGASRGSRSRE